MCGILGYLGYDSPPLEAGLQILQHRGPDDAGVFREGPVALGMRRLSIIDLAGSRQPLFNEDRSLVLVFNGEIYNYRGLRRELLARGHHLATEGDAETILHLYEEYGDACVHRLQGMFAFLLWDTRRRRLFAARDRLGIKPLYYHWDGRRLALASEIKALRLLPEVGRAVDPVALEQLLALRYVPGPRTIYAGIQSLQPGRLLRLEDGTLTVQRYWAPVIEEGYGELAIEDAARETRRLLEEAVASHLVADVPLGVLLSGGLDSAGLVALMRQRHTGEIRTFTVGFHGARSATGFQYDETVAARAVAEHFGTAHEEVHVDARVTELLPALLWHLDQPVADPAALPTYLIARVARRSVTVGLSGEGADELFGGYPRYAWAAAAQRMQGVLPRPAARLALRAATHLPREAVRRQARLLLRPLPPAERFVAWTGGAERGVRRALLSRPLQGPLPVQDLIGAGTSVQDLMRADVGTWLVDDILAKADRMSMAASLELRVPYLDHQLVDFMTALPERWKCPVPATKPLLRRALAPLLPPEVLRVRKHAFSMPVSTWLRGDLRAMAAERLLPLSTEDHGLLDRAVVRRLWQEHQRGERDHAPLLWTLLCLEVWYAEVFRQPNRLVSLAVEA